MLVVLLPQNEPFSASPPLEWGVARNAVFAVLGATIIALLWRRARHDRWFRFGWLAITLSFAFSAPVVLFAQANEVVGLLMMPKAIAYVWLVWMCLRAASATRPPSPSKQPRTARRACRSELTHLSTSSRSEPPPKRAAYAPAGGTKFRCRSVISSTTTSGLCCRAMPAKSTG